MRIDVYLCESKILSSRTEAKNLINEGAVFVDGKQIMKPSFEIDGLEDKIFVDKTKKQFVSRGGLKLFGALTEFGVSPKGKLCIDIGASSGGFTDCLIKNGAEHVIAIDSGYGQIVESLRKDGRVTVIENYNARYLKIDDLEYRPNFAVMDVSFISAKYIIKQIYEVLSNDSVFICLIKPQFEVGRANIGKGGIVKDEKVRNNAVKSVIEFAEECGFQNYGIIKSPIKGGDGNTEFLAYFKK